MNCEKTVKDKGGNRQCKNKHYQDGLCKVHHHMRFGPYRSTMLVTREPPFSKGLAIILLTVVLLSIAAVFLSIAFSSGVSAEEKYNPIEQRWETTEPGDTLKYNPMTKEHSYEAPESTLNYQPMQRTFEYTKPESLDTQLETLQVPKPFE